MANLDLLSAYAFDADVTGFAHRQRPTTFMPESRHPGTETPAGGITVFHRQTTLVVRTPPAWRYSAGRREVSRAAAARTTKTPSTTRLTTPSGSVQLPMSSV